MVASGAVRARRPRQGPFLYAGIDDHYFTALALNDKANPAAIRFDHTPFVVPPKTRRRAARALRRRSASRSTRRSRRQRFFFGPKAFDQLRAIDTELVRVINFGMFSWLAVPLLGALKWVHQYVGNWGWAIIALTDPHQPGDVPAAPEGGDLHAQDAGDPAADEGHPGALRRSTRSPTRSVRR